MVTYSGIISSLPQSDKFDEAVSVFQELLDLGLKPEVIAIASILPAARFGDSWSSMVVGYAHNRYFVDTLSDR